MTETKDMISKLRDQLSDPQYRKAFVASQINFGIPFQLRALLKSRGKTQEWLARECGHGSRRRISGLMTPGRTRPNIETLRRLAEIFDCGLEVRFVPFSELARQSLDFDPEAFEVAAFDEDSGFTQYGGWLAEATEEQRQVALKLADVLDTLSELWGEAKRA